MDEEDKVRCINRRLLGEKHTRRKTEGSWVSGITLKDVARKLIVEIIVWALMRIGGLLILAALAFLAWTGVPI